MCCWGHPGKPDREGGPELNPDRLNQKWKGTIAFASVKLDSQIGTCMGLQGMKSKSHKPSMN